ncbi:hypothetical protein GRJ2_002124900 [Grus japonensis]|uniref:Uncharacterized protein n=1 Tax=Grus japonensis TaxID=30415 RepID=A0ABC9XGX4_GRUJA
MEVYLLQENRWHHMQTPLAWEVCSSLRSPGTGKERILHVALRNRKPSRNRDSRGPLLSRSSRCTVGLRGRKGGRNPSRKKKASNRTSSKEFPESRKRMVIEFCSSSSEGHQNEFFSRKISMPAVWNSKWYYQHAVADLSSETVKEVVYTHNPKIMDIPFAF